MCRSPCINWAHSGDGPCEPLPADFPFEWARRALDGYVSIRDFHHGDYYPLTGHSRSRDAWMAYQLDRPERGDGLVVVLRRPERPYESARLPLRGVDAAATYTVRDLDTGERLPWAGRDFLDPGLPVAIAGKPGSALLVYSRK
jgi:alpha-galactosidase